MIKIKTTNIEVELSKLKILKGRTPETSDEEAQGVFATLAPFDTGGVFVGSFEGDSPWERHIAGDELVQILKGKAELTIIMDEGEQTFKLSAGMVTVVPKGLWHRFHAPDGVTVLTVTPHPTDHSSADDPRLDG
ncbi:MAG: cupin domain-containing protein [Emcibacteraceae bacterium]|nr:cupin domain-containing protein [Emcibacteraceae bacterium]